MTIVIVKRVNENVLLMGDTKVTDPNGTAPEVWPGRLKIVTIAPRVTIAFAGLADPADVALREAAKYFRNSDHSAGIDTVKRYSRDFDIDFIIAMHSPSFQILLIRRGGAIEIPDYCAIGDESIFKDVIEFDRSAKDQNLTRGNLHTKFLDRMLTGHGLGPHVGGAPIVVEATSERHRYLGCTGAYTYEFPVLWGRETHQSIDQIYTGQGHFQLSVMPSQRSDVPVVGVCLLQARTGYIYSPLDAHAESIVELAPAGSDWEDRQQEMYETLRARIEHHAQRIAAP